MTKTKTIREALQQFVDHYTWVKGLSVTTSLHQVYLEAKQVLAAPEETETLRAELEKEP